jgi:hypothetical protein
MEEASEVELDSHGIAVRFPGQNEDAAQHTPLTTIADKRYAVEADDYESVNLCLGDSAISFDVPERWNTFFVMNTAVCSQWTAP